MLTPFTRAAGTAALLAGFVAGSVLFVGGLVPLGRWLRCEEVISVHDPVMST